MKREGQLSMVAAIVAAMVAGCGGDAQDVETQQSALESTGVPVGAVCGLQYERPGSVVFGFPCEGVASTGPHAENNVCLGRIGDPITPPDFGELAEDGDRGLPACNGFHHFAATKANGTASTMFRLPRGTACGFKEACNDRAERCMGFDANVSCPPGWLRKIASDMNAPSGCGFVWCEYQDPNNLCTTKACFHDNQPMGLACGITDTDSTAADRTGQCMGFNTRSTSQPCPAGYSVFGNFDDGRGAGHGVRWCARDNGVIIP